MTFVLVNESSQVKRKYMSQTKKFAIVGLGNIGRAVATNLAKSKRPFVVADRKIEKARELSEALGTTVEPTEIGTAVKQADIILLAIPFPAIAEFLQQYASDLAGKIIIDPSNPIAPDEKGGFKKIIGQNESAGEINAATLPKGARLVKAFGTLGAETLKTAAYQNGQKAVLFYATDGSGVDSEIQQLITDSGFAPIGLDGLDQSVRLEVFGDLHEFGALGKTVTVSEAKAKLHSLAS